jgi:hypothetical protein
VPANFTERNRVAPAKTIFKLASIAEGEVLVARAR